MLARISIEATLILLMILANGVFAMAEIAVLSARQARLTQRAREGDRGAQAALDLLEKPNRFLSSVQVGITLVGVLSGAFGGATIAQEIAEGLQDVPWLARYAEAVGVGVVVVITTYLTLVLGELVPKRIALSDAEGVSARIARPMRIVAMIANPVVRLLSISTEAVVRLLGVEASSEPDVSEEEIRILVEEGAETGVLEVSEGEIVERVLRLDELRINQIMTPHTEVRWLDVNDDLEDNLQRIVESSHKTFPVCDGSLDNTLGFVRIKSLWRQQNSDEAINLREAMSEALYVPETTPALNVLEKFKQAGMDIALVIDEFGSVEGLVTLNDLLEAMVGDIPLPGERPAPRAIQREDGTWLVDAQMPTEMFKDRFDLQALPGEAQARFKTVGGYVMTRLERIPQESDVITVPGLSIEVVDMDGYRVDKVLIEMAQDEKAETGREET